LKYRLTPISAEVRLEPLPSRNKVIAGLAGSVDTLGIWVVLSVAYPILGIELGISPAWVGAVLMLFRLWDGFTDPVVGWISDRSKNRLGRRRRLLLTGSILSAVTFPLLWFFDPSWSDASILTWFCVFGLIFYSCFTIWSVPYASLMVDLSENYDERTSLFSFRTVFQALATVFLGSIWYLVHRISGNSDTGGDAANLLSGMRVLSFGLGVFILVVGAAPLWFLKGNPNNTSAKPENSDRAGFIESLRRLLKCREMAALQLIYFLFLLGGGIGSGLGYYVTTFYLFDGATETASFYGALSTVLFCISNITGVFLFQWISKTHDKLWGLRFAMYLIVTAILLSIFCYTPVVPQLHLIPSVLVGLGNAGFYTLGSSLLADIVDLDELRNGSRLTGGFASVHAWVMKLSMSLSFALSGVLIEWSGFREGSDFADPASLERIRYLFILVPFASIAFALWIHRSISLSRTGSEQVRQKLDLIRSQN